MNKIKLITLFVTALLLSSCTEETVVIETPIIYNISFLDVEITQYDSFDPYEGVNATDNEGNTYTDNLNVSTNLDTTIVGSQSLTYQIVINGETVFEKDREVFINPIELNTITEPFTLGGLNYEAKQEIYRQIEEYMQQNYPNVIPLSGTGKTYYYSDDTIINTVDYFYPMFLQEQTSNDTEKLRTNLLQYPSFTYLSSLEDEDLQFWYNLIGTLFSEIYTENGVEYVPQLAKYEPVPITPINENDTKKSTKWEVTIRDDLMWYFPENSLLNDLEVDSQITSRNFIDTVDTLSSSSGFYNIIGGIYYCQDVSAHENIYCNSTDYNNVYEYSLTASDDYTLVYEFENPVSLYEFYLLTSTLMGSPILIESYDLVIQSTSFQEVFEGFASSGPYIIEDVTESNILLSQSPTNNYLDILNYSEIDYLIESDTDTLIQLLDSNEMDIVKFQYYGKDNQYTNPYFMSIQPYYNDILVINDNSTNVLLSNINFQYLVKETILSLEEDPFTAIGSVHNTCHLDLFTYHSCSEITSLQAPQTFDEILEQLINEGVLEEGTVENKTTIPISIILMENSTTAKLADELVEALSFNSESHNIEVNIEISYKSNTDISELTSASNYDITYFSEYVDYSAGYYYTNSSTLFNNALHYLDEDLITILYYDDYGIAHYEEWNILELLNQLMAVQ